MSDIFDDRPCRLGEGPLWHPERRQFFWFDILNKQLLSQQDGKQLVWEFEEHVSAAGWVDRDTLLIASETQLFRFEIESGAQEHVAPLEADQADTRSNDGRADPWGGFWIGTMGFNAEPKLGAIYRFYQGVVEPIYDDITISNSICFAPDKSAAYYTDTVTRQIMRQGLKENGWPTGPAEVLIDLTADNLNPDGSVVDADGCIWNAQWGAGRVARYSPQGTLLQAISFPAAQITCPAFGGTDFATLYATSAYDGKDAPSPQDGQTFSATPGPVGLPEYRVIL